MKNTKDIAVMLLKAFLLALMLNSVGSMVQADGLVSNSSGGGEDKESDEDKKTEDEQENDESGNENDNCGQKGGPVSLFDGKERTQRTDIVVKGLFSIHLTRQYDSQSKYDSQLGYGWSLNHDRRLYQYPDGSVVIRYGCGSRDRFLFTGGAYVTPKQGRQGTLTENPDGSFVYRRRYGTTEYYDPEGRFTAVQNKYGHRLEYTYDPAGKFPLTGTSPYSIDPSTPMTVAYQYRMTRIDERAADGVFTGNFVTLAYSATTGRLMTVTASDGRSVSYVHDTMGGLTSGNLEQVNGLEAIVTTHRYEDPNDPHNLTYVQNEQNATAWVMTYDSLDRVIQQDYGNDALVFDYVVDYTETTATQTITDAAGLNPYDIITTYEFDANGDVALMRDHEGNESIFLRDIRGDLVSRKYYENQGSLAVPDLVLRREIEFTYDAMGRMLSRNVTLDNGEVITQSWTWDNDWMTSDQLVSSVDPAKIFRTEYDFHRDGLGVPTNISQIRSRKSDGSYQVTAFNYDTKNRLRDVILPDGQKMVYTYEGGSLFVTKQYFEIAAAESLNRKARFTYDSLGNLNSIRDANDNLYQLVYDDLSRVTSVTNPLGEENRYTYDTYRLVQSETGYTVAAGEGQVVKYTYTPQGWISQIEEKGDLGSWHTMAAYTHDSAGQQLSSTDALGRIETYTYDGFGQTLTVTDPLNKTTTFAYDLFGNEVSVTDAEGRQTLSYFDDLDRETRVERPGVSPAAVTSYSYDASGNLTGVTDAEGRLTTFEYDTLSRLTAVGLPLGQTEQYVYDDRNRVDYLINRRGQKIDFGHELWGPVSSVAWYASVSAPTPERTVSYGLDVQGNTTALSDDSVQAGPLYTFTYDALNRPDVTTATYIPGSNRTLDDGFDRYGNRDSLVFTDSSAYSHSWSYDKRNRLTSSSLPGGQAFGFMWLDTGQLQQISHQNGTTTNYTWRNNGPVESVVVNGTSGILGQFSYTYDGVHNVDTMTDADGLHDYAYDGLDRLTQATYPAPSGLTSEDWVYDRVGNREDAGNPSLYAYDDNNRIVQGPSFSYVFDDDGNLLSRSDGASLTFDETSRLETFTTTGVSATYVYDPFGRRISKTVNGVTTWFLWDDVRLIAEFDGSGNRLARYAYNPQDMTAAQFEDANGIYEVHTDNAQLPRFLTDSGQQVVWSARYSVFGAATINNNTDGDGNVIAFSQRFPGQYEDGESGFFYNYYRYYDPSIGRYISADPLSDGDNWYAYANNNGLMYSDLFGLVACGAMDRLKSAGWAGVAAGYYGLSKGLMEPALGALDWGINQWGNDSDLAGEWRKHVSDPMVQMGSVFTNRTMGRRDSDALGGKVWGYGEDAAGVVGSLRGAGSLQKQVSKKKPGAKPGKGKKEHSIKKMWGYATNKKYGWRAKLKWARKAANKAWETGKGAYDMTKGALTSGQSLGERITEDESRAGDPQNGHKAGAPGV